MARQTREIADGVMVMTAAEILANIDFEARAQLNMSGEQFVERYRRGELPHSPAVFDIGILVSLLDQAQADAS